MFRKLQNKYCKWQKAFNTLAKTLAYYKHLTKNIRDVFSVHKVTLQYTFRNVNGDVIKKTIFFWLS